jgi:hypothetical protein
MSEINAGGFLECRTCGAQVAIITTYALTDEDRARPIVAPIYHVCLPKPKTAMEEAKP